MALEKVIINHVDGGTVEVLRHVESLEPENLSKNQKRKLKRGYYSKEKHVAMLTALIHDKYHSRKANNKNGILPSQMAYVRQATKPIWLQAHDIREQEKRI
tara:strand:- start:319 stop:621 length:303 start_codon:yes stop_codon:yes gene_type:complete